MMKSGNINRMSQLLQNHFRSSKRSRISLREGAYIVVDDRKEAVDLVKKMFAVRNEKQEVLSATNVSEAKKIIEDKDHGRKVRVVIIDLSLDGFGEDADGFNLANWLYANHPEVPFIFATGRKGRVKEIEKKFPGVDIFLKGTHNIDDFANALGLNECEKSNAEEKIPTDAGEKVISGNYNSPFSFLKKMLSF